MWVIDHNNRLVVIVCFNDANCFGEDLILIITIYNVWFLYWIDLINKFILALELESLRLWHTMVDELLIYRRRCSTESKDLLCLQVPKSFNAVLFNIVRRLLDYHVILIDYDHFIISSILVVLFNRHDINQEVNHWQLLLRLGFQVLVRFNDGYLLILSTVVLC